MRRYSSVYVKEQQGHLPANRIWKTVGFKSRDWVYSFQIFLITEPEQVPTPSLNTRLFLSTSGRVLIASGGRLIELKVWEKACPIRAAHFAGDLMAPNSPRRLMTKLEYSNSRSRVNGAMNQQVWDRSEECEKPRNYEMIRSDVFTRSVAWSLRTSYPRPAIMMIPSRTFLNRFW